MRRNSGRLAFSILTLIFALIAIVTSFSFVPKARLVPLLVGVMTLILAIFVLLSEVRPSPITEKPEHGLAERYSAPEMPDRPIERHSSKKLAAVLFWIAGFLIVIFIFGFHISTALFTFAFIKIEGKSSWINAILIAGILWAAIFVLFDWAMGFNLFRGWIFGEILPHI